MLSRADPVKPIISKIKGMFGGENSTSSGANDIFANLMNLHTPTLGNFASDRLPLKSSLKTDSDALVISAIQKFVNKYSRLINENINVAIEVLETQTMRYFIYDYNTGINFDNNQLNSKLFKR